MILCDYTMIVKLPLALLVIQSNMTMKHVEVDSHCIKEKLQTKQICIPFVMTKDQLANVFTKGLCSPSFSKIICKLGTHNIYILA